MSQRLGLGTILVETPEEAKRPEIAARIICAYFTDRSARVSEALDRNDLTTVRRVVAGGALSVPQFSAYYDKVLNLL